MHEEETKLPTKSMHEEETKLPTKSMHEEDEGLSPPILLPLTLALGFLSLSRPQALKPLKPLSTAVKLVDGALKASQPLRHPDKTLFLVSKALLKAYNASGTPSPSILSSSTLKPYIAAANLLKYARAPLLDHGLLDFKALAGGYKVSKNLLRVLEGLVGLQLDSVVKKAFKSVGILIKATDVAAEVRRLILIRKWRRSHRRRVWVSRSRYAFRLRFINGLGFHYRGYEHLKCLAAECFSMNEDHVDVGRKSENCLLELLSLAIPVDEGRNCS